MSRTRRRPPSPSLSKLDRRPGAPSSPRSSPSCPRCGARRTPRSVELLVRQGTLERTRAATRSLDPVRRARAAHLLGQAGHRVARADLERMLRDRDEDVRRVSAAALGHLGDPRSTTPLLRTLAARRAVPASVVASAVAELGQWAHAALFSAIGDESPLVRAVAIEICGLAGAVPASPVLRAALRHDGQIEVRVRAARALGRLGVPDAVADLVAAGGPKQPAALRMVVARALGDIGSPQAVPGLRRMLGAPEHRVAANAAAALARLGGHGVAALRDVAAEGGRGRAGGPGRPRPGRPECAGSGDRGGRACSGGAGMIGGVLPALIDGLRDGVGGRDGRDRLADPDLLHPDQHQLPGAHRAGRAGVRAAHAADAVRRPGGGRGQPADPAGLGPGAGVQRRGRDRAGRPGDARPALSAARGGRRRRRLEGRHRAGADRGLRPGRGADRRTAGRAHQGPAPERARAGRRAHAAGAGPVHQRRSVLGDQRRGQRRALPADGHRRRRLDPRPGRAARGVQAVRRRPAAGGCHRRGDPGRQRLPGGGRPSGRGGHAAGVAGPDPGRGVPARLPDRSHRLVPGRRPDDRVGRVRAVPSRRRGRGRWPGRRLHRRGLRAGHQDPPPDARRTAGTTGSSSSPSRSRGPRSRRPGPCWPASVGAGTAACGRCSGSTAGWRSTAVTAGSD